MRCETTVLSLFVMVAFSKFTGQRGSQQLLDSDGFTYNFQKERTTVSGVTTWRCSKNRSMKCPSSVFYNPANQTLAT